jgi:hypothetical protein
MYFPTGFKDFRQDTLHCGSEKARGCSRPPGMASPGSPPPQEYLLKVIIHPCVPAGKLPLRRMLRYFRSFQSQG